LVLGLAKKNYGVQMYQNVTGSFFNKAKVGGLPNSNLWDAGRNMTYVPNKSDNYDDFMAYGKLNFYYAYASSFISGMLYPTISEK
jgi:hypothetical protein